MNMEIFRLVNNLANKNAFLDNVMLFFSEYMIKSKIWLQLS